MYVCRIVCVVLVGILLRSVCRTVNMHASYSNQRKLACHCTLLSDQSHFFSVSCVS
jgi:accessory gene regulator protein AgrB